MSRSALARLASLGISLLSECLQLPMYTTNCTFQPFCPSIRIILLHSFPPTHQGLHATQVSKLCTQSHV